MVLGATCTQGFVLPLGRRGLVTLPDSGVMTHAKGQTSPLVPSRLSRQSSRLVRTSAGSSAASSSKNPPLDKVAVLRYVAATALQWGAIIAFMGGAEYLAKLVNVKQTFFVWFVRLFFAFMSLRYGAASPAGPLRGRRVGRQAVSVDVVLTPRLCVSLHPNLLITPSRLPPSFLVALQVPRVLTAGCVSAHGGVGAGQEGRAEAARVDAPS